MRLPNGERAVVDLRKITEYSLNHEHDDGKHKARLFRHLLGIGLENVEELVHAIKTAVREREAVPDRRDRYGDRYIVDFAYRGPANSATIRTVWIIRGGEDFPRLVTCYIL